MTVLTGVIGAIFIFTTRNTPARESNSDALAFLLLFWLILPVIFAVPYLLSKPHRALRQPTSKLFLQLPQQGRLL